MQKTTICPNCGWRVWYDDRHEFYFGICGECKQLVPLCAAFTRARLKQETSKKKKKFNEIVFIVLLVIVLPIASAIVSRVDYFEDTYYPHILILSFFYTEWRVLKQALDSRRSELADHVVWLIQPMLKRDDKGNPIVVSEPEK